MSATLAGTPLTRDTSLCGFLKPHGLRFAAALVRVAAIECEDASDQRDCTLRCLMEGAVATGPVGVVLVHGIGRQKKGEATTAFIKALRRHYGHLEAVRTQGDATVVELPRRVAHNPMPALHFYEAHWADLLTGDAIKGTVSVRQAHIAAWLPWLNQRTGMYPRSPFRDSLTLQVLVWTILFTPAELGIQLLIVLARLVTSARNRRQAFDTLLDDVPGDVFNYVESALGALERDSPLYSVARSVSERKQPHLTRRRPVSRTTDRTRAPT